MSGMRKDLGLLLVRAAVGGTLVAHGAQKLFGAFGGGGIDGTATMFEMGGFRPARQHAMLAGLGETAGGTLLSVITNIHIGDIGKTALLAAIGAIVSFFVSLLLKVLLKRFQR